MASSTAPGVLRNVSRSAAFGASPWMRTGYGSSPAIRSASDRGVLAVLYSRIVERGYGRRFLASLPPARLVHDVEEVARFFAS